MKENENTINESADRIIKDFGLKEEFRDEVKKWIRKNLSDTKIKDLEIFGIKSPNTENFPKPKKAAFHQIR